jgi:hypothetical protein
VGVQNLAIRALLPAGRRSTWSVKTDPERNTLQLSLDSGPVVNTIAGIAAKVPAIKITAAIKLAMTSFGFEWNCTFGHFPSVMRSVRRAARDGPEVPSTVMIGRDISKGSQPSPARDKARCQFS